MKNCRGQSFVETLMTLTLLGAVTFTALWLVGVMVSERWLSKLAYDYLDCINLKKPRAQCFQEVSSQAKKVLPLGVTKIKIQKSESGIRSVVYAKLLEKKVQGHGFFPKENFKRTSSF